MVSLPVREYIVISGIILTVTALFRIFFRDKNFIIWGRLLFIVITAAYFARNFFIFASILFLLIHMFVPKNTTREKLCYYLLLLPLIPPGIAQRIPFPGLEQLFTLTYPRMLNIFILLPIFLNLINHSKKGLFKQQLDKFVALYFLYIFSMGFRDSTLTNAFREGLNLFIDYFILYFVISRTINETDTFKAILRPMIFIASILAVTGVFETLKGWHVYSSLTADLGSMAATTYAMRLGFLRATGSFGSTIPFGMYLAVMIGFTMLLQHLSSGRNKTYLSLLLVLFFVATLCTISRGPLVLIGMFFFIFALLARQKTLKLLPLLLAIGFALLLLPITTATISTLPFIGKKAQGTIDYRKTLWNNSLEVVKRSPLTGSNTYLQEPEMIELEKAGGKLKEGGIDIVSAYLQIMLRYGMIGLSFFAIICLTSLGNLLKAFYKAKQSDTVMIGKILFSITMSYLISIATVSMVSLLPFYFWFFIGLCTSYSSMILCIGSTQQHDKNICVE